jgi:hypothetical protein
MDPADQAGYESTIRSLQTELGEERFAAAWEEGTALALEQAAAYGLEQ